MLIISERLEFKRKYVNLQLTYKILINILCLEIKFNY